MLGTKVGPSLIIEIDVDERTDVLYIKCIPIFAYFYGRVLTCKIVTETDFLVNKVYQLIFHVVTCKCITISLGYGSYSVLNYMYLCCKQII